MQNIGAAHKENKIVRLGNPIRIGCTGKHRDLNTRINCYRMTGKDGTDDTHNFFNFNQFREGIRKRFGKFVFVDEFHLHAVHTTDSVDYVACKFRTSGKTRIIVRRLKDSHFQSGIRGCIHHNWCQLILRSVASEHKCNCEQKYNT